MRMKASNGCGADTTVFVKNRSLKLQAGLMRIYPSAFTWLRNYQPAWLAADAIAGVTLAAYLLPAAIGDASLANLPPQAGLYACLFSGLVFWIFCGSLFTSITVTSAISLVLGVSLAEIAGGDAWRFTSL